MEIPILEKILEALKGYQVTLENLKATKIGIVLRKALRRAEFSKDGPYPSVSIHINDIMSIWESLLNQFARELGL